MLTSITSPTSVALRLRALTPRIRGLGDRPLYELLCELVSLSSAALPRVEAYGALGLHADFIAANGGRDLPPAVWRVKWMNAAEIAHALRGKRSGRGWTARCPAHDDHDPSLSITESREGVTLVHCHAGCEQRAVIDALRARGLWAANGDASHDRIITPQRYKAASEQRERENAERAATVQRIWDEAGDPLGTAAEEYLAGRKLQLPPELRVFVLRFHPACPWESGTVPCLIAAFRAIAGDKLTGVHRVRLDQPERWPRAERKMLGNIAGSAVKLDAAGDRLAVAEGVETAMAARQLGLRPTWALGSATGIKHLPMIDGVEELMILGENDNGANRNAAEGCRENWKQRRVLLTIPRGGLKDFNDVLMERTHALSA